MNRKEWVRGAAEQPSILVLDAENRSSLAVIRSLGREGFSVIAAGHKKNAIGLCSKFVNEVCYYSDPAKESSKFINEILDLVKEKKPRMLIPCTDLSLELILEKEEEFRTHTLLPFSNKEIISSILDKSNILKLAADCGIAVPRSTENHSEVKIFPVAIKTKKSFNLSEHGFSKPTVKYANSKIELEQKVKKFNEPVLIQQKIIGPGIGVFTLSKQGKVLSVFCHKRILEKPPTGGVSVLSESIAEYEAPVEQSKKLIEKLKLDGIAMLEYKQHSDGKFYLMEINPRFWGSLQLAISSGRDFPVSLIKVFIENKNEITENPYTLGLRMRWILGSLDHLIIRIKKEGFFKLLFSNPLMLFKKQTCYDVFDTNDIKPFIRELRNYL